MSTVRRTAKKDVRHVARLAARCGYRPWTDTSDGHELWTHPDPAVPDLVLPSTPRQSTIRRLLDELRRRHPDVMGRAGSASKATRRRNSARAKRAEQVRASREQALAPVVRERKPAPVPASPPERTRCVECQRPHFSPLNRPCPACGGRVERRCST